MRYEWLHSGNHDRRSILWLPYDCPIGVRREIPPGPHQWNLFDIDAKYADVEPLSSMLARINSIE